MKIIAIFTLIMLDIAIAHEPVWTYLPMEQSIAAAR